jgi:hypothetical protein
MEGMSMDRRKFVKLGTGLVAGLTHAGEIGASAKATAAPQVAEAQRRSPLRLELKNNQLRFGGGWCEIPEWRMGLEVGNELLQTTSAGAKLISEDSLNVEFHFPQRKLTWCVKGEIYKTTNTLLLRSAIRNESGNAVPLGKAFLLQADKISGFFSPGDNVVYLPMFSGGPVQKLDTGTATSDLAIQAFNQSQNKAFQAGFVTFQRAKSLVAHDCQPAEGLRLKAWCEFDGWELPPGTSTPLETLIVAVGGNPHAQLEAWADHASLLCHPHPREWEETPNGWLGISWVDTFYVERFEDTVLRNAKAIRQRLAGFELDYIWTSIANLKDEQPGNWLDWNYKNFPDGPQYFHEQLQELGFKWGLWCGAFLLSSRVPEKVEEFKDALLKQPDGNQPMVYLPEWRWGPAGPATEFKKPLYALDPSHPKTLEYLRKVFQAYRDWGVRYYMIDFLGAAADTMNRIPHAKHYDKKLVSGPEVYRKGLQAIREACGDDTHLLECGGPTIPSAGFMDSVRTGNDFGEGRPLNPLYDTYPGTMAINLPSHWTGPLAALTNQASTYHTHRKLYINNSGNVLTVDKPLALNQAQVYATIHVMSGGPSMLGDDITIIDEERLSLIKKTLPRPKDVAFPVDLFSQREQAYPRVFHRQIVQPWGSYDVVAVYNLETERSIQQDVELKSLGLDEGRSYLVWEFWSSEYVRKVRGQLRAQVPPYSVKVYRLTEDTGRPTILGTDMHVLMGEVEIDRCDWDASQRILFGRAIRPGGERGSVYLYAPPKMGVTNPKGVFLALDKRDDSLIIRCPLQFDQGRADWRVKFFDL